ncbi:FkbM family methyltransferase [Nocardioides hwasunensis]|uniref:FkbM family methyltransferase n=1 Tax=Nocardioides hwasunensis TaxID=397258 RepID=A0ABR8MN68_9ACTN|nr:FkbM family methyltransferase [Nocardioides hwasunensis]MBD3917005.1 FkbM family methyltransferase [Nocardioides hwasunensis]
MDSTPSPKPTGAAARATGLARHGVRLAYGAAKTAVDSARSRQLVSTRWVPSEDRWHYHWPEGRVADEGRWKDAQGWATRGFYYGMDDLLFRRYRPRQGDVVFDVGAGDGGETFYLASMVGSSGRVVSIEAAPSPFRRLQDLVSRNAWLQVTPLNVALASEPGTVSISDDPQQWVAGNIFEADGSVDVEAETFDDLCERLGIDEVHWVKMNIEGAEKDALRGMERMAPHIQNFTISCHDFLGTDWGRSKDEVLAWLDAHGFAAEMRGEGDFVQQLYVYAWR